MKNIFSFIKSLFSSSKDQSSLRAGKSHGKHVGLHSVMVRMWV